MLSLTQPPTQPNTMFETCQRAQTSHSLYRVKRLEWNAPMPDITTDTIPPSDTRFWFRAKSDLAYQRPSIVIVESPAGVRGSSENPRVTASVASQSAGSESYGERADAAEKSSGVLRRLVLSTVGFFEFLFSDRWEEGDVLRVMPGQLLNNLLHGLVQLEKYHDVISYVTLAHTRKPSIEPCMKTGEEEFGFSIDSTELGKVLVEMEFFCPNEKGIATKIEEPESTVVSTDEDPSGTVSLSLISGTWTDQDISARTFPTRKRDPRNPFGGESTVTDIGTRSSEFPKQSVSFSQELPSKTNGAGMAQEPKPIPEDDLLHTSQTRPALQPTVILTEGTLSSERLSCMGGTALPHLVSRKTSHKRATSSGYFLSMSSSGPARVTNRDALERLGDYPRSALTTQFNWPCRSRNTSQPNASTEVNASIYSPPFFGFDDVSSVGLHGEHLSQEASRSSTGEDEETGLYGRVRCNIRGQAQPLVHTNCESPYHMVREPFFERRHRLQSGFPPVQSQPARKHSAEKDKADRWSDRWEDDAFLGPKHTDNSEMTCSEPVLEKYHTDSSVAKKSTAAFAKNRTKIVADEKKEREKEEKRRKRGNKKKRAGHSDEDEEFEVEEAKTPWKVDTERAEHFRKDIDLMQSEFFVDKNVALKGKRENELKKTYGHIAGHESATHLPSPSDQPGNSEVKNSVDVESDKSNGKNEAKVERNETPSTAKCKKQTPPVTKQKPQEKSEKTPGDDASSRRRKKGTTYKALKSWKQCPDFRYFYYYLSGKSDSEIQSLIEEQRQTQGSVCFPEQDSDDEERLIVDQGRGTSEEEKHDGSVKTVSEKERGIKHRVSIWKGTIKEECVTQKTCGNASGKEKDPLNILDSYKSNEVPSVQNASEPRGTQVSHKGKQFQLNVRVQQQTLPSSSLDSHVTGKTCLKSTVKSQSENQYTVHRYPCAQKKKREKPIKDGNKLNHVHLTKEQDIQIREAGLVISDIDPWHIYVPATCLSSYTHGTADLRNGLLKRRETINRFIAGGKVILQINKSRVWSLVRQVPTELERKDRYSPTKTLHPSKADTKSKTETRLSSERMAGTKKVRNQLLAQSYDVLDMPFSQPGYRRAPLARQATYEARTSNPGKMQHGETKVKQTSLRKAELPKRAQKPPHADKDESWNIDEGFDNFKLRSTYSFEKMFAHRMKFIPRYWQRIGKYERHDKKKKASRDSRKKKSVAKRPLPPIDAHSEGQKSKAQQQEEGSPDDLNAIQDTHVITSQFFHHLLLALKLFVVRKERVTSVNPVQSRVSITFSRRHTPGVMVEAGDMTSVLDEADINHHAVSALCRTLLMQ